MKTKEEILTEFGCPEIPFNEEVTMFYPAILSAMDEYAAQFGNLSNNKQQNEQLENLLFEVYEKGLQQKDCNLTHCIKNIRQALRTTEAVNDRRELLLAFIAELNKTRVSKYTSAVVDRFLKSNR
jgi:hypothetical protein